MRYSKLLILLFIPILFILPANASYGRYAILIFGGYGGAQESFDERIYISAEMAYLFETLIEQCDYENDNIYVFNLSGEKNTSSHYDLFTDSTGISEVVHYFNANFNTFKSQCNILNDSLDANSHNLLTIFICGHQSHAPDGTNNTRQWYKFSDAAYTDSAFAVAIRDELLEELHDVNSKTHVVFVTGFCASAGFYNDSPSYDELYDVVNNISFAAADTQNTDSAIFAGPQYSFMRFWVDQLANNPDVSINNAYYGAEDDLYDYYNWQIPKSASLPEDVPIKYVNPSNWDQSWNLNGVIPPNNPSSLTVTGSSDPRASLEWTDNSYNETGFKVYRSVNDGEYSLLETLGVNVTTYNDYDISDGNTYSYKVAAYRTISGWTSFSAFTNEAELSLICWIEGPTSLLYREDGTWYAHYAGQPQGDASFQWYKRYNYSNWAAQGTDSSQTLEMRTTDFWVRLDVTISSVTVSDSIYVVFDDSKRLTENDVSKMPTEFFLHTNYPNPFNPETIIHFDLPTETLVRLSIYDISGREITILQNEKLAAGHHQVRFNASHLASGIYFYKITAGEFSDIRRMFLIK